MAMRHGDFSAAETLMRATSAQYPGDAEAWGLLAAALARQGKNAEAIDACRKALALKPSQNLSEALQKLLVHLGAA
jgi:Flp pilus assembly protein TadD